MYDNIYIYVCTQYISISYGLLTFVNEVAGSYLRSVPGNKMHAVCKIHQIKCGRILGKRVAQLISRHRPDFVLFIPFFHAVNFNVLFFLSMFWFQTEALPSAQSSFSMNLEQRPAAVATFEHLRKRNINNNIDK